MQTIEHVLTGMRVGQGYDVHRLVAGRKLLLGGVHIEASDRGLLGHSDADALLHAVTDAVLGAAALGDIGRHFSDSDPQFEGVNSGILLEQTLNLAMQHGFRLLNVDSTLICQSPKLSPYMPAMHESLARLCRLSIDQVNIKAKTNEKLGYLGREEAIEAQAVVLMMRMC